MQFGVIQHNIHSVWSEMFESMIHENVQSHTQVCGRCDGSVNITKTRYAVAGGLIADAVGLVGAILIGYAFYH